MIAPLLFGLLVQCPDGSPPPCARAAATVAAAAPDPRRIAILPFRISASDTLFGEGLAELLAGQMGGDESLRPAHMGTVLRAWRRAGGGGRSPLDQTGIQRVARELGAGRVVEGSVVGVGNRLTLSVNMITIPAGRTTRIGPFSGPADSLESMVGRLASGIMGASGGGHFERIRLTDNPDAMRAYLEGVAEFRARRTSAAGAAFERAFGLDSSFARAALMRFVAGTWLGSTPLAWGRRVVRLRDRLSAQDRILMTAFIGEDGERRTPSRHLADRQRAVSLLPESPEALYELGDYLFHSGAAHNIPMADAMAQARSLFERSLALDTQATVLEHLLDVAFFSADTAALRRHWPAFDGLVTGGQSKVGYGLLTAEQTGDAALRSAMVRLGATLGGARFSLLTHAYHPALGAQSIARMLEALPPAANPAAYYRLVSMNAVRTGRPSDLAALRREVRDSSIASHIDLLTVVAGLYEGWDSLAASAAASRLQTTIVDGRDSVGRAHNQCGAALWAQRSGEARYEAAFLSRHRFATCAAALDLQAAWRSRAADVAEHITRLDSLLRDDIANGGPSRGFENRVLARVIEERGDRSAALNAIRLRLYAFGFKFTDAGDLREEGRLAALLGDAPGAIRAYRRYLNFYRDAEPALHAQRDSVRSELTRLGARP